MLHTGKQAGNYEQVDSHTAEAALSSLGETAVRVFLNVPSSRLSLSQNLFSYSSRSEEIRIDSPSNLFVPGPKDFLVHC